eukprot:1616394-Amphidinium_carterae.1
MELSLKLQHNLNEFQTVQEGKTRHCHPKNCKHFFLTTKSGLPKALGEDGETVSLAADCLQLAGGPVKLRR